jgi:hypothetical protein
LWGVASVLLGRPWKPRAGAAATFKAMMPMLIKKAGE